MFKVLLSAVLLAIAARAYQVVTPGGSQGWVTDGENTVTWGRVNTDPDSFDLVLTNTVR